MDMDESDDINYEILNEQQEGNNDPFLFCVIVYFDTP